MALPVNKPTLDKTINDNILLNNNTQFITAKKLQDTLYPIANSTFGMKTIWAGQIRSTRYSGGIESVRTIENYYDPNYFPPVQEPGTNGSVVVGSNLNKYQVTSLGSVLKADNGTDTGEFTNIGVTPVGAFVSSYFYGQGLTFDGYIQGGVLTRLTVNNPGAGYCSNIYRGTQESVPYAIDVSTGQNGQKPIIEFNLKNTLFPAYAWDGNGSLNIFNVFIPNINSIFQYINAQPANSKEFSLAVAYRAPIFHLSYSQIYWEAPNVPAIHTISSAMSKSNTIYTTIGTINQDKPGFAFLRKTITTNDHEIYGFLEIKVPIINTTLPV